MMHKRIKTNQSVFAPLWFAAIIATGVVLRALPAEAQQYYDPGILRLSIPSKPEEYAADGVRLGAFTLRPALEVAVEDHDNIYYQNQGEVRDTISHYRPMVALSSGWSRHSLSFSAAADLGRFDNARSEDYDDVVLSLDGRIDVRQGQFIAVRAASMDLHEDRSSPDDPGGITPTEFNLGRYSVAYSHNFNRLTATLLYQQDETEYETNVNADGDLIDSSDRDRTEEQLSLRLEYLLAPQRSLFFDLGSNRMRYDLAEDFEGFSRDSDGVRVKAGAAFDITGVITGDVWVQYLQQDYADPRFADLDDVGFGAGLHWYPTQLTSVHLRAEHTPLETTQSYTSSYLASLYSARVQHELKRWLLLHARVSYTDNEYALTSEPPAGLLTGTKVKRAGLGLSYLFNPRIQVTAGYAWEDQDANRVEERYTANRFFLVLGLEL